MSRLTTRTVLAALLALAAVLVLPASGLARSAAQTRVRASAVVAPAGAGVFTLLAPVPQLGGGHAYDGMAAGPTFAAEGGAGLADRVVIGKMADISSPEQLLAGERTLLPQLPKLATSEAQWAQNERVLLQEMESGNPIRDASVDPFGGELMDNTGYLARERAVLQREGWMFDPESSLWAPGQ